MKPYVPITAAILVPLLALEPACATTAPRQQLQLAFLDEDGAASEEDRGIVEPEPAPIVELSDAEVAEGFRTLARDPQLIAFFRHPEGTGLRLLPASYVLGDAFVPGYNQLCATRGQLADCLGLLGDGAFDTDDRQRVAMSIAWHSVLSGVALELGRSVDPQRLYVMVMSAMVGFMAMLAFPEPITKLILTALTLAAVAYVGWDTLFGIRDGWKALKASCDSATSFADLRAAGERFGTIIGERVGRIIVMLVVAAMGASLGSFTARISALPGFARAAQLFQARCGFSFEAVARPGRWWRSLRVPLGPRLTPWSAAGTTRCRRRLRWGSSPIGRSRRPWGRRGPGRNGTTLSSRIQGTWPSSARSGFTRPKTRSPSMKVSIAIRTHDPEDRPGRKRPVSKSIPVLVEEFARHIQGQQEAMRRGDVAAGNKHSDEYFAAWRALRDEYGDAGRDALAVLFQHANKEVKLMAATLLLRHKTAEATHILEEAVADGDYAAELTLERWRDGTWAFDPAPKRRGG